MASSANSARQFFNFRAWVTWLTTVAFLIMAVSGVVLYIAPRGRVANWEHWTVLGLEKTQWSDVHMTAAILLLVAIGFHLYFNWKPLCHYLKSKSTQPGFKMRLRELLAASIVGFLFVAGTLMAMPPFSVVTHGNEEIKDMWETNVGSAGGDRDVLSGDRGVREGGGRGGSGQFGRMTLDEYCQSHAISLTNAITLLNEQGASADAQSRLRDLAYSLEMTPRELADWLDEKR